MPSGVEAITQMGLRDEFARLPQRTVVCMGFYVDDTRIIRAEWPEVKAANAIHIVSQSEVLEPAIEDDRPRAGRNRTR